MVGSVNHSIDISTGCPQNTDSLIGSSVGWCHNLWHRVKSWGHVNIRETTSRSSQVLKSCTAADYQSRTCLSNNRQQLSRGGWVVLLTFSRETPRQEGNGSEWGFLDRTTTWRCRKPYKVECKNSPRTNTTQAAEPHPTCSSEVWFGTSGTPPSNCCCMNNTACRQQRTDIGGCRQMGRATGTKVCAAYRIRAQSTTLPDRHVMVLRWPVPGVVHRLGCYRRNGNLQPASMGGSGMMGKRAWQVPESLSHPC